MRPLVIWLPLDGVNPDVVLRKTLYVTPLVVLAVHVKLIWLGDAPVAARFVGGFGGADEVGVSVRALNDSV